MRAWVLVSGVVLAGCESLPPRSHSAWDDITDRAWRVTSIDGERLLVGSTIEVTFGSDGVMVGEAQNRFRGAYTVKGEEISIEPVAATQMFFDEPAGAMLQEGKLFVVLQDVTRWEGKLVLATEDGREVVLER